MYTLGGNTAVGLYMWMLGNVNFKTLYVNVSYDLDRLLVVLCT